MKSETVKIRLDTEEKREFQRAADIVGISLSAWMREKLRRAAIEDLRFVGEIPEFLTHLLRQGGHDERL